MINWWDISGSIHDKIEYVYKRDLADKILNPDDEFIYDVVLENLSITTSAFKKEEPKTVFLYVFQFLTGEFKGRIFYYEREASQPDNRQLLSKLTTIGNANTQKEDIKKLVQDFEISGSTKNINIGPTHPTLKIKIFQKKRQNGEPWIYQNAKVIGLDIILPKEKEKVEEEQPFDNQAIDDLLNG